MSYTLGEAARVTGKNKTTIARAIQMGKMSATRNSDGSYSIDPAELSRVFPLVHLDSRATVEKQQRATEDATLTAAVLSERVAQLEQRLQEVETQRDQWHAQAERLTMLLTASRADPALAEETTQEEKQPEPPRPWWKLW